MKQAGTRDRLSITCRAFLVVESFINLVCLPDTVLSVPMWSPYMPRVT